jgi:hypothetical protein
MLDLDYIPVSSEFLAQMGLPVPSSGNAHVVLREKPDQTMEEQAFQATRQRLLHAIHELGYNVHFQKLACADGSIGTSVGISRKGERHRERWIGGLEEVAGLSGDDLAALVTRKIEEK